MSKNGYDEFKEALKSEDMLKQLSDYLAEHNAESKEEVIRLTVQFAEDKGYYVSEEDLSAEAAGLRNLDDEEMKNVSGGAWCMGEWSCIPVLYWTKCDVIIIYD